MHVWDKIRTQTFEQDADLKRRMEQMSTETPPGQMKGMERGRPYKLDPGYIFVPAEATVVEVVVGSGLATCLFDGQNKLGGINHFELPESESGRIAAARYADVALNDLWKMMQRAGARMDALSAQIYGAAFNPEQSDRDVGQENYTVTRKWLAEKHIALIAFDIGGSIGRNVRFNSVTNACLVSRADAEIRDIWYPYGEM